MLCRNGPPAQFLLRNERQLGFQGLVGGTGAMLGWDLQPYVDDTTLLFCEDGIRFDI